MRAPGLRLVTTAGAMLAIFAACADAGDALDTPKSSSDDASTRLPEGDASDVEDAGVDTDATDEGDVRAPPPLRCSEAGWCETRLPTGSVDFYALVPFEKSALALGWLDDRTTPLEFDGNDWKALAGDAWVITPKKRQVLRAVGAQTEDEIWVGGEGGIVAHGVRTAGSWTWTQEDLGTRDTILSIAVVGPQEVYAATSARLYRWGVAASDAGAGNSTPVWSVDFEYEEPTETSLHVELEHVVGTSADDVWLIGARVKTCLFVAHRIGGTWATIYDSDPFLEITCSPRDPFPRSGRVIGVRASGINEILTHSMLEACRITHAADGTPIDECAMVPGGGINDIWQVPGTNEAFTIGYAAVRHVPNFLDDNGSWTYSTIAFQGAPTLAMFNVIGGTSTSNLWVVGDSHALHKTTP